MHHVLFLLKRAGLLSIALQKKWLVPYAITPARYEMLFVIAHSNEWLKKVKFVHQSDIRRQLGVTAATVCKMLKALEKLGYVRRARSKAADRRQVNVELTRKGRGLLRKVHERVIRPGHVFIVIYSIFAKTNDDPGIFVSHLELLRKRLSDPATFYYPWCDLTTHPTRRRRVRFDVVASMSPITSNLRAQPVGGRCGLKITCNH